MCLSRCDSNNGNSAEGSSEFHCVLCETLPSHYGSSAYLVTERHELSANIDGEKLLVILTECTAATVFHGAVVERASHNSLRICIDSGASSLMLPCVSLFRSSDNARSTRMCVSWYV